ncbi:MAG: DUF268 domain-containing protein [Verrucomicrobiota bacterium]|nr:DUF268 domain-containing protein [Verrucomicrobiota bacterium]
MLPPASIPETLFDAYTLHEQIPVEQHYLNDTCISPIKYTKNEVDFFLGKAARREANYYGITDLWFYDALEDFSEHFLNQEVAIIGSTVPWYESIVLHFGGKPFTIDYNPITVEDSRLSAITVAEYQRNPRQFDVVVSISSYEHDGLGRYGDLLDPNGDLKAMEECKRMLKPNGILILAVPVGPDLLVWNAHRIYGKLRLPMLLNGWRIIKSYGFDPLDFLEYQVDHHQPIFVLTKNLSQ